MCRCLDPRLVVTKAHGAVMYCEKIYRIGSRIDVEEEMQVATES